MSNIMKLTDNEVRDHPWDILKKIEKTIRGEEKEDGVKFDYVNNSTSPWRIHFGGISIETCNVDYKKVHRRVKVVFIKGEGRWEIDLDKIKEKYEEMKKLAKQFEKDRKKRDKEREENKNLITKLKGGLDNIRISGGPDTFAVEIYSLTKEEVGKVVEFVKEIEDLRLL